MAVAVSVEATTIARKTSGVIRWPSDWSRCITNIGETAGEFATVAIRDPRTAETTVPVGRASPQ